MTNNTSTIGREYRRNQVDMTPYTIDCKQIGKELWTKAKMIDELISDLALARTPPIIEPVGCSVLNIAILITPGSF